MTANVQAMTSYGGGDEWDFVLIAVLLILIKLMCMSG